MSYESKSAALLKSATAGSPVVWSPEVGWAENAEAVRDLEVTLPAAIVARLEAGEELFVVLSNDIDTSTGEVTEFWPLEIDEDSL